MECVSIRVRVVDTERGGYLEIGECRDLVWRRMEKISWTESIAEDWKEKNIDLDYL